MEMCWDSTESNCVVVKALSSEVAVPIIVKAEPICSLTQRCEWWDKPRYRQLFLSLTYRYMYTLSTTAFYFEVSNFQKRGNNKIIIFI